MHVHDSHQAPESCFPAILTVQIHTPGTGPRATEAKISIPLMSHSNASGATQPRTGFGSRAHGDFPIPRGNPFDTPRQHFYLAFRRSYGLDGVTACRYLDSLVNSSTLVSDLERNFGVLPTGHHVTILFAV